MKTLGSNSFPFNAKNFQFLITGKHCLTQTKEFEHKENLKGIRWKRKHVGFFLFFSYLLRLSWKSKH